MIDSIKKLLKSNKYIYLFCKGLRCFYQNGFWYTFHKVNSVIKKENSTVNNVSTKKQYSYNKMKRFIKKKNSIYCNDKYSFTVVIPVYNSFEKLDVLLKHLFERTNTDAQYVFIDDASTDERIYPYLKEQTKYRDNVVLLRNDKNLGFTGSVNKAMSFVKTKYAIWLNTDVQVPYKWVERILKPFAINTKIATVTPFTNSGVYFSFPENMVDNEIPSGYQFEMIDDGFQMIDDEISNVHEIHSGCGFCMAINMECWLRIGCLDEKYFPRGYGEEVDWCMRAIENGWKNVLAPNLFVFHNHGASFASEEKERLINEHYQNLIVKHKELIIQSEHFNDKLPWQPIRNAAIFNLLNVNSNYKNNCLMIDINLNAGGACAYRDKQIKDLLKEGTNIILLQYNVGLNSEWKISIPLFGDTNYVVLSGIEEVVSFIETLNFSNVFVNNLAFCEDVLSVLKFLDELKLSKQVKMIYVYHDFFSICPSFFLLNKSCSFCNAGYDGCENECIKKDNRFACIKSKTDLKEWRKSWKKFLEIVDEIRFFSQSTKSIVEKVYPCTSDGLVFEHKNLCAFESNMILDYKVDCMNIAFVGPWVEEKGKNYILQMSNIIKKRNLNIRIYNFGDDYTGVINNIIFCGRYVREELPDILSKNKIHVVAFPSPCPESFSYVVQELMQIGAPIVCFDIGAPAERLRKYNYKYCEIVDDFTSEALLEAITKLYDRKLQ